MPGSGGEAITIATEFDTSSARCAFMKTSSCCIMWSNSYAEGQHMRQGEISAK